MKYNKDLFSANSKGYKKYRPSYPEELFEFLASISSSKEKAWDCGCGSGQASIELSKYFKQIVATDISSAQIKDAEKGKNIEYEVRPAEDSGLDSSSIDLVLCAQSLHWFSLEGFYSEIRRVLKPGGIIAVCTYNLFRINKEIDELIDKFYWDIIYNYWPKERKHIENAYNDLEFPFEILDCPEFSMKASWSIEQLIGYLNTWSGVLNYTELEAFNPMEFIEEELLQIWNKDSSKLKNIVWPLTVKVGRINNDS